MMKFPRPASISPLLAILAAGLASPALAAEDWRLPGFSMPESALFDSANNRIIVSNIIGDAMQADGNGSLALVSPDGKMLDADWVTGLDAPKGSAIADGKLYVADLTNLRIVDLSTGAYETVPVPGSGFLNDVTADGDGNVYLTDTFANAIYRYADGKAELWLQDAALVSPNGILADGATLYVASIGVLAQTPADSKPGGVYAIDIATKAVTKDDVAGDFGFLDGIVKLGETLYLSDFMSGVVYSYVPGSAPTAIATLKLGSADIGSDGTSLYVPLMMEGEVVKLTP